MVFNNVKRFAGRHIEINKILLLLLLLWTCVATCSFIRTNKLNNNASAANTTSNRIITTSSNKSATPFALPTYVWGYTTKYATVLYDEDIIVKGPNALNIYYPENGDSNNMTIIGIYASDKLDVAATALLTAQKFSIYLLEGGIGHNFTTVHFVSNTDKDLKYNLKIYGLDI